MDAFTDEVGRVAGEGVRARMEALAILDVVEVRPILDMGQGWERSI